jgi:uncharacterized membrane protein YczE
MNKVISKCIIATLCVILVGIGASLGLKAAVGVGAWDALSQSIAGGINIKVGTISMILNVSCVLIQLVLLKKDFKAIHASQILVAVLLGVVVNFMFYNIYSSFIITNYFINIGLLLLGVLICAIAVSTIMAMDFISFPLEACCMVISKKINKKFGMIRQLVDILSIVFALGLAFIFNQSITVREGTVIAMLVYGPLIDLFMKFIVPRLKKLDLVY